MYAPTYKYLALKFTKCNNSTGQCKDPSAFLANTKLSLVYSNAKFNQSNIERPVATVLSDNLMQSFLPGYQKQIEVLVQNQEGQL